MGDRILRYPTRVETDEGDVPEIVELPIDGILDLHGFDPKEVAELVTTYLDECRVRGILEVRLIHGKGKGHLRRTVHALLERRDDVVRFALATDRSSWGATLVTLEPPDRK